MATLTAQWKNEIQNKKFTRAHNMHHVYKKQRSLGSGAFGEGWLCTDLRKNRNVVVKISHGPMTSEKEEFNAKKEVAIMETMHHPNVVEFYEAWIELDDHNEERLHIAMEYCDSGDLGTFIKERLANMENRRKLKAISDLVNQQCSHLLKGLTPEALLGNKDLFVKVHGKCTAIAERVYADVIESEGRLYTWSLPELEAWLVQLLWGIWYIHKKRVVHRDIKPDNIFLTGGGKIIKIGDFGISGLQAYTNAPMQTRAGTPLFMAPEMWRSGGTYTDRCDVYALAVMFYEIISLTRTYDARLPCSDKWGGIWGHQHIRFLKEQVLGAHIRPMELPQEQIESSFYEIVKTMMRKDPKLRPTAGQVLRSLRMQTVSRRVIDEFRRAGELSDGDDPLVKNSDSRHKNTHNPVNNQFTLHDTARFQCSTPDSEVLMLPVNNRITVRSEPSFAGPAVGYMTYGDIIEVTERITDKDGVAWVRSQSGWCITHHEGRALMRPCPEGLLNREPESIEALGLGAYGTVVKDVQSLLREALKAKLESRKASSDAAPGSSVSSPQSARRSRMRSPRSSPTASPSGPPARAPSPRQNSTPTRRASLPSNSHTKRVVTSPVRRPSSPVGRVPRSPVAARAPSPVVVRRPASPVRPGAPAARRSPTPTRARQSSSRCAGEPAPAARAPAAARAAPPPTVAQLKEKMVQVVGKNAAKQLFHDYYRVYSACFKKGLMTKGMCNELKTYETELKGRLGAQGRVVGYLRECAKQDFSA